MKLFVQILQPASAILLVLLILAQRRGAGLSAVFGGTGSFYATKRGAEKILAVSTMVLFVAFLLLSFFASVL